ncbi:hypothetical protein M5689_003103 [Euphorbia peplus]|nr:hypothetical protein M5689_003103 [Euphorbia peplus]
MTEDLGLYLGMPTIHGRLKNSSFQHILDRVSNRLAGWKAKTLSFAGRTTLIKSILTSIPFYSMQTISLPVGIIHEVEKMIRRFLWGDSNNPRPSLLNWNCVTSPKKLAGLGVINLGKMNLAFLAKLGWRCIHDQDSLWSKVVCSKYIRSIPFVNNIKPKSVSSVIWQGIVKAKLVLEKGFRYKLGNGHKILFWLDPWLFEVPIINLTQNSIPFVDKFNTVNDYWNGVG